MTDESQISEREREILRLVATGATNQQIASQLNISVNTVKVHLRNIFGKIGVVSRTEATLYAVRSGLVTVERVGGVTAVADDPEEPAGAEASPLAPAPASPAAETAPLAPAPADPTLHAPRPAEPAPAFPPIDSALLALPPAQEVARAEAAYTLLPAPQPASPPPTPVTITPTRGASWPLLIGLAAVALLVGALLATLLPRPEPQPTVPTAVAGALLPGADQRWVALASMPDRVAAFALASVSFNGASYLYVIGGETPTGVSGAVLRYDVAADTWARYTPKPTPVADVHGAVIGGKIYVPGGRTADGSLTAALEVYDPQSDVWSTLAPLPAPRSRYALAAVEGKLYLFGGWDGADFTAQVWQYSPDTNVWAELTPMAAPRADAAAAEIDDQVYLVGGENRGGRLTRHDRYSPAEEGQGSPWEVRAPLPEPHSQLAVAGASDQVFIFGGPAGASSYDIPRDAWQPVSLPAGLELSGLRAQFVGSSKVYIVGGRGPNGLSDGAFAYQALFFVNLPVSGN